MSTTEILREINTIDGVAGSFVCDQSGQIVARSPVSLFDDGALADATRALVETAAPLLDDGVSGELDLLYEDGRLVVRPLPGALLCVLCVPRLNMALLNLRTSMALKALRQALADETAARMRPASPADRLRAAIERMLGDDSGKVLAMVPEGDLKPEELRPTAREIERFTRLFIGRDQAEALAEQMQSILSGS